MINRTIRIKTPRGFEFAPTVLSHGWCELPPFRYDDRERILYRTERLTTGKLILLAISERTDSIAVKVSSNDVLNNSDVEAARAVVVRCLNLESDLSGFYAAMDKLSRYRWISGMGAGRLLISPTIWEDLAKTLLTTNTTWNVTLLMCKRLASMGELGPDGTPSFPTPSQIAATDPAILAKVARIGYRSPYLHELARRITSGDLKVEVWRDAGLPTEDLRRALRTIKGFGDYATGSMLKLLGHYDRIGIDTSCRDVFRAQISPQHTPSDAEIAAYYSRFGQWQGLVLWMDVMKVNLKQNVAEYKRLSTG